jgi:hypothetical protein
MSHPSLNLAAHDFDAYAPEKASSNAFTRPRIEVKQRALAWARGVVARLAELGIAVDVHGSDEHPSLRNKKRVDCQWVFFWRDQAARDELERLQGRGRSIAAEIDDPSPFTRHAFLALRLDATAVEVCFAVHPEAQVDVENLRARLAEARDDEALTMGAPPPDPRLEASPLTAALRALPEQFSLGLSPEHRGSGLDGGDPHTPGGQIDRVAASAVTSEALQALLERAAAGQVPLWIGWSVARDTAVEHSAILDEQLEDAIVALAPIYRLVAWSRENDRIALDRRMESAEQERARAHVEAEAQTERWRTEQAEARRSAAEQARARAAAHDSPGRKPSLDTLFAPRPHTPGLGPGLDGGSRPHTPGTISTPGTPSTPGTLGAPARWRPASVASPSPDRGPEPRARKSEPPPGRLHLEKNASERPPPPAPEAAPPSPEVDGAPEKERAPSGPSFAPVVEKGGKVRVLSGPFADKIGVVGELDGRGGARVLLGLLSTRLDLSELEPVVEGRERPSLQSSHRRPLAPAPRKTR